MVAEVAVRHDVEPRALAVRTLLQLPRVAKFNGQINRRLVETELRRSAEGLRIDQRAIRELIPTDKFALRDLRFVELEAPVAEAIFSRLHYLRNARSGSLNYALVDPIHGLPVTMCSVSPLEWKRVARQVETQFGVPQANVWDVSRVYSFDVAPPNAISSLLAKVRTAIRQLDAQVDLLSTAVDPNLGFHGSSYRAANWQLWMSIQARPYLYVDRVYASPRQLLQRFETANLAELAARHGAVVEQSRARLLDSLIFCCRVRRETEQVAPDDQRRLRR
ncbi:hypothetical protein EV648_10287 [Kribbella sp. VKM Ac-2568]|nr:hypothetical protein EV648_10287 [Kribbella sp. VKM Ac-2568]